MINGKQIAAARIFLDWTQEKLASETGLAKSSIQNAEKGYTEPRGKTMTKIKDVLEKAGMEFFDEGVRRKRDIAKVLEGESGLWNFYNEVASTAEQYGGEFLAYSVEQHDLLNSIKEHKAFQSYRKRVIDLTNFNASMIISNPEKSYEAVSYIKYRVLPTDRRYTSSFFYVYRDKVALVTKEDVIKILVIEQPSFTELFRQQFYAYWEQSKDLPITPPDTP